MLSPFEAIGFQKCVMATFDTPGFVSNWERLRKIPLRGDKAMKRFIEDVRDVVWDRLPIETRKKMCHIPELENKMTITRLPDMS